MRRTAVPRTAIGGTVKRSVTIGKDVDEQVRKLAGAGGFSAFLNDAALMALQAQGIRDWLVDFEAQHGAITEEEMQAARRRLAAAGNSRK
jgi:hypothetical protein